MLDFFIIFFFFFLFFIDVPNFGAKPQSVVGSIEELRTDYSKMKKNLAHDNCKLDETGGEYSKGVENIVEKGEIAP